MVQKVLRRSVRLFLVFSILVSSVQMIPGKVHAEAQLVQSAGGTTHANLTVAPKEGNVIIVSCYRSGAFTTSSVIDNKGNSYAFAAPVTSSGTGLAMYYTVVRNTGSNFRVSCSGWSSIVAYEYSGIDTQNPLATPGVSATGYSTSVSTTTINVPSQTLLIETAGIDSGGPLIADPNKTVLSQNVGPWRMLGTSRMTTSPESTQAHVSLARAATVKLALATFRLAQTGPPATAPAVSIVSPIANTVVSGETVVQVQASPTDSSIIDRVELRIDGTLIGTDVTEPYSFVVQSSSFTNAQHTISAVATTSAQLTAESNVVVVFDNPKPPTATLASPLADQVVSGYALLAAQVSDDEQVSSVSFSVDGVPFGQMLTQEPYEVTLDTTQLENGQHTVSVRAIDNDGLSVASEARVFTVYNMPLPIAPSVHINPPLPSEQLVGIVTLQAIANSNDIYPIDGVQFSVDGQPVGTADTLSPYTFSWDTALYANGPHEIIATAVTTGGASNVSEPILVEVNNPTPTPPQVSLVSPIADQVVEGSMSLQAEATDDRTVSKVEFFIDGTIVSTDFAPPYAFTQDSRDYVNGIHTVHAVATDDQGLSAQSASVQVSVQNTTTIPPGAIHIQQSSGINGATFTAQPKVGNVVVVACYTGAVLQSNSVSDNFGNVYQLAAPISVSGTSLGVYYAVVQNTGSNFRTACGSWSSVAAHEYSGVDVQNPLENTGSSATAWSTQITTPAVQVTSPNTLLFEAVGFNSTATETFPAEFTRRLSNVSPWDVSTADRLVSTPGSVQGSIQTTSNTTGRIVIAALRAANSTPLPTTNPSIQIVSPVNSAILSGMVNISAVASPTDHTTINRVEFSIDGVRIGQSTTAPYQIAYNTQSLTNGNHTLRATAFTSADKQASQEITASIQNDATPPPVGPGPQTMNIISSNKPAFASSGVNPSNANNPYTTSATNTAYDIFGNSNWEADSPVAWLAYDLSSVPQTDRELVDIIWYNDSGPFECCSGGTTSGIPSNYTIEAHTANGGGDVPVEGWTVLATVEGNISRIRESVVNLSGYNWIRLNVQSTTSGNVSLMHMDVYDLGAATSPEDSWAFFGDSITEGSMNYAQVYYQSPVNFTFSSLINETLPGRFPAETNGGVVGVASSFGVTHMDRWLANFPGKYVSLAYGTNDSGGSISGTQFYANYEQMVQKVLAAGKVPIVPLIPWSASNYYNQGYSLTDINAGRTALLNNQIQNLYTAYPQIVKGPDFEKFFYENSSLLISGDVHPSSTGYGVMRKVWACQALKSVYSVSLVQLQSNYCSTYFPYLQ